MTRVKKYRVLYLASCGFFGTVSLLVQYLSGWNLWVGFLTIVLLLVPGRVHGHYFRSIFKGRKLLEAGKVVEAEYYFKDFLQDLDARPWLSKLQWLQMSTYTSNSEAMTWNNLAGCSAQSGDFEQAELYFDTALQIDPEYPIPLYNLALLREAQGDRAAAAAYTARAYELGYKHSTLDTVTHNASLLLAHLEGGRGTSSLLGG